MIKLSDAALLALTKLRTRKVRTVITIVLASLLFGVLMTASLTMTGAFKSADSFRKDGLTSRYIVGVTKAPGDPLALQKLLRDPLLIAKAKARYEALVESKIAEAKKLGITYTQVSDQPPYMQVDDGTSTMRLNINDPNGIGYDLLAEKFSGQPAFDDTQLQSIADQYSATSFFFVKNYVVKKGASLSVLPSDGEKFYDQSDETSVNANYQTPILDSALVMSPATIATPFMLPNNGDWQPSDNTLPIILPQNTIERVLELAKLPDTADATTKLKRLKEVRSKAGSLTFPACYRNNASIALIQQTVQQQKEIESHKEDKDYQKPALIYSLPDSKSCQNPTVKSDMRTVEEKKNDENRKLFDKKFGNTAETPVSYFVTFKVVGVSPAEQTMLSQQSGGSRSANDILNDLLATSGVGQTIPESLYDQIQDKSKYADILTYTPLYLFGSEDNKQRFVEFASSAEATRFIDEQSCTVQYDNTCTPLGRPYQTFLAFSNSVALDDIRATASAWFGYALIGVMALAAIIMWITIGRTITDGRRETAVFRAIGFKRIDVAFVYILYTVLLSTLVAVCAAGIGFAGALLADQKLGPTLTAQAQQGFGGLDLSKTINLVGVDSGQIGLLLIACLTTGILSMLIPLLRNVRRSPIRDMRDE